MLRAAGVLILLAIVAVPINGQHQGSPNDGIKCGNCPCNSACPKPPPPPSPIPSPPPPSPPPPSLAPPPPKKPPAPYCPPPPSVPSGPIFPTPTSPTIYFTGPPEDLYPIDLNSARAATMGFTVGLTLLIGNVLLDFWWN